MSYQRRAPRRRVFVSCLWGAAPLLLVGLLVGCSGADQTPAETAAKPPSAVEVAQQHVDAAKKLLAEGNKDAAVDEFTIALATVRREAQQIQNPSVDADILYQRGVANLERGFPDTAAADFTEVLRQRPDEGPAYAERGQAYLELGDLYKAVRDCTDAIRYVPRCTVAYRSRGEAYLVRGQFDRAVADLEQAIEFDPTLAPELRPLLAKAYFNWSRQLAKADDNFSADAKLAKARELDPALVAAAEAPKTSPNNGNAVEQTVAKQVIDEAQLRYEAGLALLEERNYNAALVELTAAIDARRGFADAYFRRAQTLMALNFPDTAVKDLDEAVRYGGDSVEACRLQAQAFLQLGSPYRAALAATDALHADPTDASSYVLRGTAYASLSNWPRAIADLEQAIRINPELTNEVLPTLERARQLRDAATIGRESTSAPAGSELG
jgi:tetratricopeptide (TPR) repeat protein